MISADTFLQKATALGFGLYAGVPCSYLTPFINAVIDATDVHYVAAANEGGARLHGLERLPRRVAGGRELPLEFRRRHRIARGRSAEEAARASAGVAGGPRGPPEPGGGC